MFYAHIDGDYRQPNKRGEKATCSCCNNELIAVLPKLNKPHWRHKAGDCDPWSEPEGEWHLNWKENFPKTSREVPLTHLPTQEKHRADIYHLRPDGVYTTLELQHSPISEDEINRREAFYKSKGQMYWLVHIHDEGSFHAFGFYNSHPLGEIDLHGKKFDVMKWMGRGSQFIDKWKRSKTHVFFDFNGYLFYLATEFNSNEVVSKQKKGEYAITRLSRTQFISSITMPVLKQ